MNLQTSPAKRAVLGLALAIASSAAFAAVFLDTDNSYDPNGSGFAGKGDVQNAFGGLNNAQLQSRAEDIDFSFESSDTYAATCTWTTAEGRPGEQTHIVTIPRHTAVNSVVDYEKRRNGGNGQVTGFILTEFGATTTTGTVPVLGGSCVGVGTNGTWTAVEGPVSAGGVLMVHWNTFSAPLPFIEKD